MDYCNRYYEIKNETLQNVSFLLDDAIVVFLAWLHGVWMCGSITERQGSYAHQSFWEIPVFHQLLALFGGKHNVLTIDPARREPDGVGG